MKESEIEKKVCEYAKNRGWKAIKFRSFNNKSLPDRIFFKKGKCFLIEFKVEGKLPTKLQQKTLCEFRDNGFAADVIDSVEKGIAFITFIDKKFFGISI